MLGPTAAPGPLVSAPAAVVRDTSGRTAISMRRVDFHVAPGVVLHIRNLNGELETVVAGGVAEFDDAQSFIIGIANGEAGLTTADLSRLLNQYVFAYPGAPLYHLRVSGAGKQLRVKGTLRKGGDIPFEILAAVAVTPKGEIRLRPSTIRVARVPAGPLFRLVGLTLEKLVDLKGARGARADGNDLYLQPDEMLPPPRIRGRLAGVRLDGEEVLLTFDDPSLARSASRAANPPDTSSNWVYFRHGTVRFGRLFMVNADLELVDAAPGDPFDFSLADYQRQLVAGYVKNTASGGLVVHAPDLRTLGSGSAQRTSAPPASPF